jgi:DNA helicase-2/ATP-dependent DNA helicase PcrA
LDFVSTNYQERLGLSWTPSPYQVAIWQWVEQGRGSLVVEAVAGSGKSTTIKHAARLLSAGGLFLAFNKSIATELAREMPAGMVASTIHAHGFQACRALGKRIRVEGGKYRKMAREVQKDAKRGILFGRTLPRGAATLLDNLPRSWPGDEIEKLINLARLDLLDPGLPEGDFATEIDNLAVRHGLDWPSVFDGVVPLVVQRLMLQGSQDRSQIDFTDMVWLPTFLGLSPKRYAWIFVDECQDLSRAALALITASVKRGGRILFVGDRRQAIYAFAGADAESFARTLDYCKGATLPLSVCYRCPTSALALAREYCPQIEARTDAPAGVVRDIKADDVPRDVREGDMVLCRTNAPLVALCFRLIGEGVAAQVRGRSIGDGLIKAAREADILAGTWDRFGQGIDAWAAKQGEILERKITDEDRLADALDQLGDKVQCLRVIWARSDAKSLADLEAAISDIFSDDRAAVQLSSVHKAKGLEARRVYILHPELLPSPRARTPEQVEQERNLTYVALTRCQDELIWIDG